MAEHDVHLRLVNESGFPLQIAVEHLIRTRKPAGWKVWGAEHAWKHDGADGFIDLILQKGPESVYIVLECKRVRDVDWIFLSENGAATTRRTCIAGVVHNARIAFRGTLNWELIPTDPPSSKATYCVVRGQANNGSRPMLERTASELLVSTEALILDAMDKGVLQLSEHHVFFSAIVTTANLYMSQFNPDSINMSDGTLPAGQFTEVPYLRFHKQLHFKNQDPKGSVSMLMRDNEIASTVFIVNSSHLEQFLREFDPDPVPAYKPRI